MRQLFPRVSSLNNKPHTDEANQSQLANFHLWFHKSDEKFKCLFKSAPLVWHIVVLTILWIPSTYRWIMEWSSFCKISFAWLSSISSRHVNKFHFFNKMGVAVYSTVYRGHIRRLRISSYHSWRVLLRRRGGFRPDNTDRFIYLCCLIHWMFYPQSIIFRAKTAFSGNLGS